MADLRDFTGKNRKFTGTIGEKISPGTTGERDTSFGGGTIRFNTTTSLMEYYDGSQFKPIDAPPTIASISPATFASDGSTIHTITVSGANFGAGLTAKFIGEDGTNYTPGTVTRISNSSLTMTTLTTMTVANEPYDIQVQNVSGLSVVLENALDAGSSPAFSASTGSLGTLRSGNLAATALTSQTFGPALDADNQQINYSITSGSLPPGLRLGTANDGNNGKIVGTATAVVSDTTSNFTISATDGVNTASRAYSITVSAPVITSYTSTGAFTFSVPSGVTSVEVLAVAGGGGGGRISGGGGGGGVVYHTSFPVTPGGTVPGSVGAGGPSSPGGSHDSQGSWNGTGGDSNFGALTAKGGGSSSGWVYQSTGGTGGVWTYGPGGSGGGGTGNNAGGTGIQPSTSNPGATNYGFPGAAGGDHPQSPGTSNGTTLAGQHSGGGGGGAGTAGGHPTQTGPGNTSATQAAGRFGGNGVANSISGSPVTYGGGGAGTAHAGGFPSGLAPGGTGGGGPSFPGGAATNGTTNLGGGGGGGWYPDFAGGSGGPGIVIVKY
jgi:hypothetical protein